MTTRKGINTYTVELMKESLRQYSDTTQNFVISTEFSKVPEKTYLPASKWRIEALPLLYSGDKDDAIASVFLPPQKSIEHPLDAVVSLEKYAQHCGMVRDKLGYTLASLDDLRESPLVPLAITTETKATDALHAHIDRVVAAYNHVMEYYGREYTQGDHMSLDMLVKCVRPIR